MKPFMKAGVTPEPKLAGTPRPDSFLRRLLAFLLEFNLVFLFLAIFVTLSFSVRYFFTVQNMLGLALSVSQIGMVACTMMFCLASRDFDLSVGSIVAFAGVVSATVINVTDNLWAGVAAALLSGAIIGCINGIIIALSGDQRSDYDPRHHGDGERVGLHHFTWASRRHQQPRFHLFRK
jgi:ABC-type xylose transport system permease subunit